MMSTATPVITVNVDVTNPGQFFACCGLLELADRLWAGAEGWFEDSTFRLRCKGILEALSIGLAKAEIHSSLTDTELRRLGSLLSKEKAALSEAERDEKVRLQAKWRLERLCVSEPFSIWLDLVAK